MTTLGYQGISVDTLERRECKTDRWYKNIDKKQHFQHVKGSGFSLLIQNFKEDLIIYVPGLQSVIIRTI